MEWMKSNPAWVIGTVSAGLALIVNGIIVWGGYLSNAQVAWLNGVVFFVVPLLLSLWAQRPIQAMVDKAKSEGFVAGLSAKHD